MFARISPEKRKIKMITELDARIVALKAHEAVIETKITEKVVEISSAISGSIADIKGTHELTKEKLELVLIDTVKERNKVELKLMQWF